VTAQVGCSGWGRTINEIAVELDADWHTVNGAVIAYGTALINDPGRFGCVTKSVVVKQEAGEASKWLAEVSRHWIGCQQKRSSSR